MKTIARAASAAFLLFAATVSAYAGKTSVTQGAWSDSLGSSATQVQAISGTVCVVYSASAPATPASSDTCDALLSAGTPTAVLPLTPPSGQNIYAKAYNGDSARVGYWPVASTGGGGGGGGAVTSTVAPSDTRSTFSLDATKTSGAGSFADITLNGQGIVALKFAGLTASGATVTYYSSNDPAAAPSDAINSLNASTGVTAGTRTTDGPTRIPIAGRTTIRLQVTVAGTGTITGSINIAGISVSGIVDIGSPIPAGNNKIGGVTIADGDLAALGAKADAASCATGQSAMACFRQLHADLLLPNPTGGLGTLSQPADVACSANTVCTLSSQSSRKFWAATNTTGSGYCRVGYGITPTATRGDPLASAAAANSQGGGRTFETTFVPQGTISAICTVASTIAVMEVN